MMSTLVGLLLLGVFLVFALLMFLEKLSALLALPLMAFTFLVVAAAADLVAAPEQQAFIPRIEQDAYGRRRSVATESETIPGRFTAWKRIRHAQLAALHERATFFVESVAQTQEALTSCATLSADPCAAELRETIRRIHDAEQALSAKTMAQFADQQVWPRWFARPPHFAGQFAQFESDYGQIDVSAFLRPIVNVLDASGWPNGRAEVERILARSRSAADDLLANHPAPPALDAPRFRFACGAGYLYQHIRMMLQAGTMTLAGVIMATLFGGMFAVYVRDLKIAERMVYWTAEFAGEHPRMICLAIFLVTGVIFASVGGLGTVIMLGTIILPILRSVGMGAVLSSGLFLMGIAMGGTVQPVSRRLWMDFYGIPANRLDGILWTMVALYFICGLVWIGWGTRRKALSNFCAEEATGAPADIQRIPRRLMIAPLAPVALVYFGGIDEITAFTAALVYMYLCAATRSGAARVFARSMITGAQLVIPPVLLMVGIGILITSLRSAPVQGYLAPLLGYAVPHTRLGYILLFSAAAPLALYRGPLNIWGMGLAVSATLLTASTLPPAAVLGAILAAGALQSVCDPTNTANVWIAGFLGITVNQILRSTIVIVWLTAIGAVVIFGVQFVP